MVVKITSLAGNGRQNYKFNSSKNRSGILLYCAGTDGITCGRKSRGDEKQLIDLEWPYLIDYLRDYSYITHHYLITTDKQIATGDMDVIINY